MTATWSHPFASLVLRYFLCILIGVSASTLLTLGFDASIEWTEVVRDDEQVQIKWLSIHPNGTSCMIELTRLLFISDNLLGRGTTVWQGEMDVPASLVSVMHLDTRRAAAGGLKADVAVMDSWIDPLRKYTEGMILHRLNQHNIEGVPYNSCSAIPYHLRVLSCLVTQPVGVLVTEFSCLGELLVAFLDYIVAHKYALQMAGVLHQDISLIDVLLAFRKIKQTNYQMFKDLLEAEAWKRLRNKLDCLTRQGILADWGYAVPVSLDTAAGPTNEVVPDMPEPATAMAADKYAPYSPLQMPTDSLAGDQESDNCVPVKKIGSANNPQGTWSWMSAQLVMAGPGQPVVHDLLHNLESFFYVLVGICVLLDQPLQTKCEECLAHCFDKLFNTFEPSVLKTIIIQSDLTWVPLVVNHISPYFKPIIPLLTSLRKEIILPLASDDNGGFLCKTSFNHDTIIELIITTLSNLPDDTWVSYEHGESSGKVWSKQEDEDDLETPHGKVEHGVGPPPFCDSDHGDVSYEKPQEMAVAPSGRALRRKPPHLPPYCPDPLLPENPDVLVFRANWSHKSI
ncbi:hypothetical protein BS17DRAFT_850230 [Gyrodon lividus]|nr:hypothetical protein BS17DRAFT_850230 [Gyrodon lividus]